MKEDLPSAPPTEPIGLAQPAPAAQPATQGAPSQGAQSSQGAPSSQGVQSSPETQTAHDADLPPIAVGARPRIGRNFRLQWEEVQKAWVLLYPEGMVKLNASAGEILRRCDGQHTVGEIVAELEAVFATAGLLEQVRSFCAIAARQRWIHTDTGADR